MGTDQDYWTGEGPSLGGEFSYIYGEGCLILDGVTNPILSDYVATNEPCGEYGTVHIAQKPPNGFGLYDMQGNVSEWTTDWYGCGYPQANGAWCSIEEAYRVRRGGGVFSGNMANSARDYEVPSTQNLNTGFRLVLQNP